MRSIISRQWSDWLKLTAALLVAVSHYSTVIVINNHWSDSQFLRFFCQGGYIGVAIFFFLSGYGLMESELKQHLSFGQFVKRRLSKVYLPYLLISLIWIPIYYGCIHEGLISFPRIVYDILWDGRDPVLWFIKILFMMYLVFYLFVQPKRIGADLTAHSVLIVGLLVCMWISAYLFGTFSTMSIPLFGIGIYTSLYKNYTLFKIPLFHVLTLLLALIGLGLYGLIKDSVPAHVFVNAVFMLVVMTIVFKLSEITPPLCVSNYWLSASFVLYIVHFKVLDYMVANWGYISFWSWALVTFTVMMVVNQIKLKLKI